MSDNRDQNWYPSRQTYPMDWHRGTREDFIAQHTLEAQQVAAAGRAAVVQFAGNLLHRIADCKNLYLAIFYLAIRGGRAPGPDGVTFDRLGWLDIAALVKVLHGVLRNNIYRPMAPRIKWVPKVGKPGQRMLAIQNFVDRVAQRAISQILMPLVDPFFDANSFGFRPGRSRQQALARAEAISRDQGRCTWLVVDIKDMFNHIPHVRLLEIVQKWFQCPLLTDLVRRIIAVNGKKGLLQGSPLSPLLALLYLDHIFDRKWRKRHPDIPMIRVADDILLPCRSEVEAKQAYEDVKKLLVPAGLFLKDPVEQCVHNLEAGDQATWLGYCIRKAPDAIEVSLPESALDHLAERLQECHREAIAHPRAVIEGWVRQQGPCFKTADRTAVYDRIREIATEMGFDDIPTRKRFEKLWKRAYLTYQKARVDELTPSNASLDQPAPPLAAPGEPMRRLRLFTDGACRKDKVGGLAFILRTTGDDRYRFGSRSGGLSRTTNNRAELLAVIKGLEYLTEPSNVQVRSDSAYVVRGIKSCLRWKAQGWRKGRAGRTGKLENKDLWQRLEQLMRVHKVKADWIKGHSGHSLNEECDKRAKAAADRRAKKLGK